MAILSEDSDSDLPDLTELLKSTKGGKSTREASSSTQVGRHLRKQEDGQKHDIELSCETSVSKSSMKLQSDSKGPSEAGKIEARAGKPKKRVLQNRQDNPLLRPICQSGISATASELSTLKVRRNLKPAMTSLKTDEEELKGQLKAPGKLTKYETTRDKDEHPTKTLRRRNVRSTASKSKSTPISGSGNDSEGDSASDSDNLSDFIVNDSSDLEIEDSLVVTPPAPRSTRKLVRGRRPQNFEKDDDENSLNLSMDRLKIKDDVSKRRPNSPGELSEEFEVGNSDSEVFCRRPRTKQHLERPLVRTSKGKASTLKMKAPLPPPPSSDVDDQVTLHYSPPGSRVRKVCQADDLVTPPHSPEPKPKSLKSPTKKPQRIPATPHRPSMDSFWDQEIVTQWNEEYSPQKTIKASRPRVEGTTQGGNLLFPPQKSSAKQAQAARTAKKAFSAGKYALAESFLAELDDVITNGQISKFAASTGGVQIIWSKKLNTTAGRANWKRESVRPPTVDGNAPPPTYRQFASIELAEKVIDDEHRLLNVLAHEFCHLANFMVSNIRTNPHGKEFKAWASKCSEHFGDRGIQVTTKHSYEIDYKYVWECENCGLNFKRHSKSIDPERHRCGSCKSKLVQVKPVPKANGEKKVSAYQMFLKANMDRVKKENPGSPQKEIMGLIAKSYQEQKALSLGNEVKESTSIGISELHLSRDATPEEDVDLVSVVKKLDFLDLTSP